LTLEHKKDLELSPKDKEHHLIKTVNNWPNFFIVGAAKAGTSSLYSYIKEIPGIYMSPIKEPNYFSDSSYIDNHPFLRPIRKKEDYLNLFAKVKDEKIVGEATNYLTRSHAYERIHQVSPQARILISLRDPVDRLFSHYLMYAQSGDLTEPFHEQLQMILEDPGNKNGKMFIRITDGMYSESVKKYLDIFGSQHVKIIIFEEWISNPKDTVEEILRFLGLNHSVTNLKNSVYNQFIGLPGPTALGIMKNKLVTKIARKTLSKSSRRSLRDKFLIKKQSKPKMMESDRENLVKIYYNDVMNLQKILGRKLPWSNFQN